MLSRSQCFEVLGLDDTAGPNAIKKAYRKLAFELHPDLNPRLEGAARRFQELNEAYVLLMQEYDGPGYGPGGTGGPGRSGGAKTSSGTASRSGPEERVRNEATNAYEKARNRFDGQNARQKSQDAQPGGAGTSTRASGGGNGTGAGGRQAGTGAKQTFGRQQSQEEILRDLLHDPFARRVFEDIYSHVRHNSGKPESNAKLKPPKKPVPSRAKPASTPMIIAAGSKMIGLAGSLKDWMRKQFDDEQVMFLPAEALAPGKRIRLQVRHGLSGKSRTIELTLPPEFKPGRPIRLKGLGKHVGQLKGDLYLRVFSSPDDIN